MGRELGTLTFNTSVYNFRSPSPPQLPPVRRVPARAGYRFDRDERPSVSSAARAPARRVLVGPCLSDAETIPAGARCSSLQLPPRPLSIYAAILPAHDFERPAGAARDSYTIVTSLPAGMVPAGYGPRASACRLPETQIKRKSETETEMTADRRAEYLESVAHRHRSTSPPRPTKASGVVIEIAQIGPDRPRLVTVDGTQ